MSDGSVDKVTQMPSEATTQSPTESVVARAERVVAGLKVLDRADNGWRRLADCQAALLALSDDTRAAAAAVVGSRLGRTIRSAADDLETNLPAPPQVVGWRSMSATLGRKRYMAAVRLRMWLGIPERSRNLNFSEIEAEAELYRDAALLIDHPTLLSLGSMRTTLRVVATRWESAIKHDRLRTRSSRGLLESADVVLKAIERGRGLADRPGDEDQAIGSTDLKTVLELAPFVTVSRFFTSRSRTMSALQAWLFLSIAAIFAVGELVVAIANNQGNFLGAGAFTALAALGPVVVVYELARPANRQVWVPRWAVIRSCVLMLVVGAFFLWLATKSADPSPMLMIVLPIMGIAVATLVVIDGRHLFSQAPISGLVSSLLAASSVLTFLYTNQYKTRIATPLLTTTATLAPEALPSGFAADPHRLVLQASITVKNDGDAAVQVVGSLYRIEGTPALGAPLADTVRSTDMMAQFDPAFGTPARFSASGGARIADTPTSELLVQADELIPMNVSLEPKETWSTTFTVVTDETALSSVRLSTEVIVGARAHLKLSDARPCDGSDKPRHSYQCWYRQIQDRTFVERFVLEADRIYLYVLTGDRTIASKPDVPSLIIGGDPNSLVDLTNELERRYGILEFTTSVEWAPPAGSQI